MIVTGCGDLSLDSRAKLAVDRLCGFNVTASKADTIFLG